MFSLRGSSISIEIKSTNNSAKNEKFAGAFVSVGLNSSLIISFLS